MDDYSLTKEEQILKEAASKLEKGEMVEGSLKSLTVEGKIVNTYFTSDKSNIPFPLKATVNNLDGATFNITGSIYPASFSNGQRTKLKKSFFKTFHRIINIAILNISGIGKRIYFYDTEGKVYIKDNDNNIYYVNSDKTGCMDQDGDYFDFLRRKEGHMLVYNPLIDTTNFDYLYITKDLEPKVPEIPETLEPLTTNPFNQESSSSNKVIYLDDYRDQGPSR